MRFEKFGKRWICNNSRQTRELVEELLKQKIIGWDIETVGIDPRKQAPASGVGEIFCHTFAWESAPNEVSTAYVACYGWQRIQSHKLLRRVLRDEKIVKVAHNGFAFDKQVLASRYKFAVNNLFDTITLSRLCFTRDTDRHGLKHHMERTLDYKDVATYDDLFTRPKVLEKRTEEPRHTKRNVMGVKVPTLVGGEYWRLGTKRINIPLNEIETDYPGRMSALIEYAILDAVAALELYYTLKPVAENKPAKSGSTLDLYSKTFIKASSVLNEMELNGFAWDKLEGEKLIYRLNKEHRRLENRLNQMFPRVLWESPKQLAELFYDDLGLPIPPIRGSGETIKATEPGDRPTDRGALLWLKANCKEENKELFHSLLEYKQILKVLQYAVKMDKAASKRYSRIRYSLTASTITGRLSCRNPNLQQIPKSDPFGFRKCFIAGPGYKLVVCDYSQLELYILASILLKLFNSDKLLYDLRAGDVHSAVARRCWPNELHGLSDAEVKQSKQRQYAKAVIYGLNYGKGPRNLGLQLGISTSEASELINKIKDKYDITKYHIWQTRQVSRTGVVKTLLGRTRELPHAKLKPTSTKARGLRAAALRRALNTPIQGSAADIVTLAMINVGESKLLKELGARPILQVHDEIILEVPTDSACVALEELKRCMLSAGDGVLLAPLSVDGNTGDNWYEAK